MTRPLLLLLPLVMTTAGVANPHPRQEIIAAVAPARFLACIVAVEGTPDNPYGLSRDTWEQHMPGIPYLATLADQQECARRHLRALKGQLRGALIRADVYELAVCWALGFDNGLAVLTGDAENPVAKDYGARVLHLYFDFTFEPEVRGIPNL